MPVNNQPSANSKRYILSLIRVCREFDRARVRQIAFRFFRVLGLLLLCAIITVSNRNFIRLANLINILRQASAQIIISIGMTVVLLTGGIDLSVGSVMTVGSAVSGFFLTQTGLPWPIALLAALGAGTALGLIGGILVAKVKLPPPIATYGMLWIGKGVSFGIMGSTPFFGFCNEFRYLGKGYLFGIPFPIWIMAVLVTITFLFLKYTTMGRSVYATGANQFAAKASGIRVDRVLISAYAISGFLAALGGVILCARLNAVDQDIGAPFLLPAIAGPVMGGTSMEGGQGGVGSSVIGALIMIVLTNGMNLLGISSLWQQFVIGLVVVLAVWLDVAIKKRS